MAEEEKKEETKVEEEKKDEGKKEKKPNWFSKTWGNIKKNVSDANRDSKIEDAFRAMDGVEDLVIYTSDSAFGSKSYHGKIDDEKKEVLIFGDVTDEDVPYSSVLSTEVKDPDHELPRRFYVFEKRTESMDFTIEEKDDDDKVVKNTYPHNMTVLALDPNVEEVKVVKVKNTYYKKKEAAK